MRINQWHNILLQIEELKKEVEFISEEASNFPMIEIDIALEKLSLIYEKILQLKLNTAMTEETGFLSKNSNLLRKLIPEVKNIKEETNQNKEDKKEKKQENTIQKGKILAEALATNKSTLADLLSSSLKHKDITALEQLKPINDLKKAISLNDKMMFIKEIFNGNAEKYNECLEKINNSQSLEEALNFLNNNITVNKENNSTLQLLLELVYRRYMSNVNS
ncbi:MAG: hypothetical protein N3A01_02155 [Bacteroidales bacterium]|nr:hypothetical protein [Bacteroidales bacterium]